MSELQDVWVVQAHYHGNQHHETTEVLATFAYEEPAHTYAQAYSQRPGGEQEVDPAFFVTVESFPLLGNREKSFASTYAVEWNEALANLYIPIRGESHRYYDVSAPTPTPQVICVDTFEDQENSEYDSEGTYKMRVSNSPLVLVWYAENAENAMQAWKNHDRAYYQGTKNDTNSR